MKQWQEFAAKDSTVLSSNNFICEATDMGLILVNGEDTRDFLQNQLMLLINE